MWIRHRREGLTLARGGRRRSRWFALVAGMTEAGFAGNQRYLIVATAGACVLGGLGAARVLQGVGWLGARVFKDRAGRRAHRRGRLRRVAGCLLPVHRREGRQHRPRVGRAAPRGPAVARPQGPDRRGRRARAHRVLRHRPSAGPFQTQMVAYELHLHGIEVGSIVTPAAGRGVPHPDGARRPARGRSPPTTASGSWPPTASGGSSPRRRSPAAPRCPRAEPDAPTAPPPPS